MSRDRDHILEQALKHELRLHAGATPQPARSLSEGGCADAETLAAWQDGGLDPAQMASVEAHVSSCAHCQAMLGAFARSDSTVSTVSTVSTLSTFSSWKWWLAPLAAGAAAVTIWMVVPEQQQLATEPIAPPVAAPVDATAPRAASESLAQPAAVAPKAAEERERKADAAAADTKLQAQANVAREDRQQLKDAAALKEEVAVTQRAAANAAAPAAPPSAAAPAAAGQRAESLERAAPAELQKAARLAFAGSDIVSPDASRRWRFNDRGIERSEDGGATWTLVRPSAGESLTAGSSPSASVCWIAGRAGVVLVTSDGTAFARVALPDGLDLTSITAIDARTATVTSVDGRRFQTIDGGRSWRQIQA